MKEGSVLLVALLLAATVVYWPDTAQTASAGLPAPDPAALPPGPALAALPTMLRAEYLEVPAGAEGGGKSALCAELAEVVRDVETALLHPRSPALTEQLTARQRAYIAKRIALGC